MAKRRRINLVPKSEPLAGAPQLRLEPAPNRADAHYVNIAPLRPRSCRRSSSWFRSKY